MKKYRVCGTTEVTVYKEVWANDEDEAFDKAEYYLSELTEYCGNGGDDKLVGVDEDGESVCVFDSIHYETIEELEDDPDYFECPDCGEQCEKETDANGIEYWLCECGACWDDDGNEFYPTTEEDDE